VIMVDCDWGGELLPAAYERLQLDMLGTGKRLPELRTPGFEGNGMYAGAAAALMRQWIRSIA
ncbi:MAG: hypothetical protein GX558_10800, partial [Clostridiales bacterium]|nr:hypothetical protein [Clostridiales bacterium]